MTHPHTTRATLAVLTLVLALTACVGTRTQKTVGEQIDDSVITARINTALIGDPLTKARNIDVEVFKGRVQLNGFVESSEERNHAATLARGVDGVASVENNLKLKGADRSASTTVDDATITTKVKLALAEDDRTKAHQINVETRNSVVQLAGFVNNMAARNAAGEIARAVHGVVSVDNQLAVK